MADISGLLVALLKVVGDRFRSEMRWALCLGVAGATCFCYPWKILMLSGWEGSEDRRAPFPLWVPGSLAELGAPTLYASCYTFDHIGGLWVDTMGCTCSFIHHV